MANIYDLSDTWNDIGTTFTGIGLNVTDTASAAGSLLMDLQVGGSSKFEVRKDGKITAGSLGVASVVDIGLGFRAYNTGVISIGGTTGHIQFTSTNNFASVADLVVRRDAANTLAQRNSTNAQTFNIYNTYTDASNYERGFMKWNTNVLEIGTEVAGTGTARAVTLTSGSNIYLQNGGFIRWGMVGTDPNFIALRNNGGLKFSSTSSFPGAPDAGLARSGTNQLQITNGSTGTGELIFIVPTSDPGIPGALWNNAGTLSISA